MDDKETKKIHNVISCVEIISRAQPRRYFSKYQRQEFQISLLKLYAFAEIFENKKKK